MSTILARRTIDLVLMMALAGLLGSVPAVADDSDLERGIAAFEAEDYERAYELLESEAEAGKPEAQLYLGSIYNHGLGVQQDREKGMTLYLESAEGGNAEAQATVAYSYLKGITVSENHEKAAQWYQRAASQGDVSAQRSMGLRYKRGEGVERDYQQAAEWFQRAAGQDDARAAYALGKIYREGKGTEEDHAEAVRWFREAVEHGSVGARVRLAWHYEMGRGVETDYDRAEVLYKEGIRAGTDGPLVHFRLGSTLKKRAEETESEADYGEALQHLEAAARGGVEVAMLETALFHLNGYSGERNRPEGYAWLRVLNKKAEEIRVHGLEDQIRTVRARMMPEQRDEGRERFEQLLSELE